MQIVENDIESMNFECLLYCQTREECYLYCGYCGTCPVSLLRSQEMTDKDELIN